MAVHPVRLPRQLTGASFVVAIQRARRVADDGDTALVMLAGDPTGGALYLTRADGTYRLDAASLLPPRWADRLTALLAKE